MSARLSLSSLVVISESPACLFSAVSLKFPRLKRLLNKNKMKRPKYLISDISSKNIYDCFQIASAIR